MNKNPHKGPFSIRVVSWYEGPNAPLQLNLVCLNCNGSIYATNVFDLQHFLSYDCPPRIVDIPHDEKGNVIPEALFAALGMKRDE